MDISYKWIQEEYFDKPLPKPEELVECITKGAFEIEQVDKKGDDYLIDVDVLPNRAHDCLSHQGIAREIGVLIGVPAKEKEYKEIEGDKLLDSKLSVTVEDGKLCPRYIGRYVQNIKVGPSPKWLQERVESIGQRSINNLVDVTNYILFGLGQPLHVFDADKLEGGKVVVRSAKKGERLETLDDKDIEMDDTMIIIADSKDPIAIAGIKGGKKAEVDENTVNIVIEAANFNPVSVRKTSQKTQIKTDASKRYENGITSEMAGGGMIAATALIVEVAGTKETVVGGKKDVYAKPENQAKVEVSLEKINGSLGVDIPKKRVLEILDLFGFEYKVDNKDVLTITAPFERLDMRIPEDVVEEVGRVFGYDNIEDELPGDLGFVPKINPMFYYQNKIRQLLVSYGYSELQTYVLRDKGEIELANSFAKDKPFIRASIYDGLFDALVLNSRNVDLLGVDTVNVFEIGNVFTKEKEYFVLGIGYLDPKKKKIKAKEKEELEEVLVKLSGDLGEKVTGEIVDRPEGGAVAQVDLTALVEKLPAPKEYGNVLETNSKIDRFKMISLYPHMSRDIAVFVDSEKDQKVLEDILVKGAGELLALNPRLFDVFKKESEDGTSKVSYAYKLVFQAHGRTLTDKEINKIMDGIYAEIAKNDGWEVR
ncbi:MAG: phenylalanine--tRNA ligase subunit beta [Candidatus Pacebacteria bacterium]|nr:phenylalanine--tRNA ligase subunit beta [Candidatus Paceibacterota bacterium]